jgi:hypothetical protein
MSNTITTSITNRNTIIDALVKQVKETEEYPYFYSVVQFGFVDNQGLELPPSIRRQFYDRNLVEETCVRIYNSLRETFNQTGRWMFVERHANLYDPDDHSIIKHGRFHLNIISSNIQDHIIEEPNRKVRRLMLDDGKHQIPIKDFMYADLEELKSALIDACIKRCSSSWVNRFNYSIKTQVLGEVDDIDRTTKYCLKEFASGENDFADIIVWKASDFISQ